jgi:membrane-bound lytic murein transglycosylase D
LKPADAARMVGMSEDELRRVNDIPSRMRIKAGSTLLVPRTASRSASSMLSSRLVDPSGGSGKGIDRPPALKAPEYRSRPFCP